MTVHCKAARSVYFGDTARASVPVATAHGAARQRKFPHGNQRIFKIRTDYEAMLEGSL